MQKICRKSQAKSKFIQIVDYTGRADRYSKDRQVQTVEWQTSRDSRRKYWNESGRVYRYK